MTRFSGFRHAARNPLAFAIRSALVSMVALPLLAQADDNTPIEIAPVKVTADALKADRRSDTSYQGDAAKSATGLTLEATETPQSVTVFTRKRMEEQKLDNINDVLSQTAGISVKEYDSARQYYYSRGFEITTIMIDGVPTLFDPGWGTGENASSTAMYEQVEVIKGATGLTSGEGNPSAAINMVRKRADSKELEGTATLGTGNRAQYNGSLDVASALNADGDVRGRAVVSHQQEDSFRDVGDSASSMVYLTTEMDLSARTRLTLGGNYQLNENNSPTWGGIPAWYSDGSRSHYSRSTTTSADWAYWDNRHANLFAELSHQLDNGWQLDARVNQGNSSSDSRLLYVSGNADEETGLGLSACNCGKFDTDTSYRMMDISARGDYSLFGRQHQASITLSRGQREFIAHSANATSVADIGNFNEWDGTGYAEHIWGDTFLYEHFIDTQTALSGSTRLSLADDLHAIVGARITNQEIDRKAAAYNEAQTITHDGIVTPYLGLLYDLNDTYTLYASYTDIFSAQNERSASGDVLDPIVGKSYETGIKAGFMDDRLIASAAVFRIEQDNLAQADGTNTVEGSADQAYVEADGATSRGYELELTGTVQKGWEVQTGWTSWEAEDADGTKVNTEQPRKMLKLYSSYQLPGRFSAITLGGGANWESRAYAEATNPVSGAAEQVSQEAYTLYNMMASYRFNEQFKTQLNIDNLTDETYYTNIGTFGQVLYGTPRTVSLSAQYDF
ncbi:TonB-dependent siderophore receptor [Parathalassolituus penaei]|uniref:TonB-dependent siderophore receptor n=1 Tax=Parathalassolituus penaei TaxID=2997323 RepID=A0A9X3EFC2_9GAMM|nr:TonB-dependent siderophore receptor [Parathalassolituus penaei]MCY0966210.1 TonB-dependent siderophore receptor [Parathalassolituus penaei]